MKTKQLILSGLFMVSALTLQAQTITTTNSLTRVGNGSGSYGVGNAFYGVASGNLSGIVPGLLNPTGQDYNTYIGHLSGFITSGSNNVFVGYNSGLRPAPFSTLVATGSGNIFIGANAIMTTNGTAINNRLMIDNSATTTPLIWGDFAANQLKFNGKVGIGFGFGDFPTEAGFINPTQIVEVDNYNLFVYGGILTEEVRVILQEDWADYVFEQDYDLPTLQELEQFINKNKHLPNIPSAKEVKEKGIELGEMARLQQEKIEELTLYIIEQNKVTQQQQAEIEVLKQQVKLLLESRE